MNLKETKVRLGEDQPERIIRLVGANRMAAFIREAVETALQRAEAEAAAAAPPPIARKP
jgi:Arc/MetJ-type ribon-helix-helix transcriptional regulator